jgi:DNA-binding LacI/PurR family transcriptional regulator
MSSDPIFSSSAFANSVCNCSGMAKLTNTSTKSREERATIREVARLAQVSRATVTRAFEVAKNTSIKQATRDRVMAAAATLNYRPSPSAQNLKSRRSRAVCFPFVGSVQPRTGVSQVTLVIGDMLAGASSILQQIGYRVEPLLFGSWEEAAETLPAMYHAGYFDAMFVPYPNATILKCARDVAEAEGIVVAADYAGRAQRNIHKVTFPTVSLLPVVGELVRQGRKKIVFTGVGISPEAAKYYAPQLASGRLEFVAIEIPRDKSDHPLPEEFVDILLSNHPKTDAIVTPDEFLGWDIFKELRKRGLDVPERITITGSADVRHPFKPLPIIQLVYAPSAMIMRIMAWRLIQVLAEEKIVHAPEIPPPITVPPKAPMQILSKTEFNAAAAAEMRGERLLAEVEADITSSFKNYARS